MDPITLIPVLNVVMGRGVVQLCHLQIKSSSNEIGGDLGSVLGYWKDDSNGMSEARRQHSPHGIVLSTARSLFLSRTTEIECRCGVEITETWFTQHVYHRRNRIIYAIHLLL